MVTLNATHQQTKNLVDAVAGTYQTVLTINSSVGRSDIVGTYNCTVENARVGRLQRQWSYQVRLEPLYLVRACFLSSGYCIAREAETHSVCFMTCHILHVTPSQH